MKHHFCNLIACLKNGAIAKKHTVTHVNKKLNRELLILLWEEGYISGFSEEPSQKTKLKIFLKYDAEKKASIKNLQSISKPGKRVYSSVNSFWKLGNCNKLVVISTNQGLKSLNFCKKHRLGGEVLLVMS